jgi:hypothetical protein
VTPQKKNNPDMHFMVWQYESHGMPLNFSVWVTVLFVGEMTK